MPVSAAAESPFGAKSTMASTISRPCVVFLQRSFASSASSARKRGRVGGLELGEHGAGKRGDVVVLAQGIGQQLGADVFHLDFLVAGELGGLDDRLDGVRRIHRDHGQRVARFIGKAGAGEGKFQVQGFLGGTFAIEDDF